MKGCGSSRWTVVPRLGVRLASINKVAGQRVGYTGSVFPSFYFTLSFRFRGATLVAILRVLDVELWSVLRRAARKLTEQ